MALVVVASGCASVRDSGRYTGPQKQSFGKELLGLALFPVVIAAVIVATPVVLVAYVLGYADKKPPESSIHDSDASLTQVELRAERASQSSAPEFAYIGALAASDFSPPGDLHVVKDSIGLDRGGDFAATLLVNFPAATDRGELSYEVDVFAACATGALKFVQRRSYKEWYGSGTVVTAEASARGIAPGPLFDSALQRICGNEDSPATSTAQIGKSAEPGIVELGPIPASEFSPAGNLSVDVRSVRPLGDGKRRAALVVNFERPTSAGEMSYMADVSVACTTGALTLNWWYSFDALNTEGLLLRRSPTSQSVTNDRPDPPVDAAIRKICSLDAKG